MRRSRKRPRNIAILHLYDQLTPYVQAFAQSKLNLLVIIGEAGLQKSRQLRQAVGSGGLWLEGHVTPFQMYIELYRHRDELVILDDADELAKIREGVRLLKSLCQTDARKTVSWHSSTPKLEQEGVPTSFDTQSRVCIIANEWKTLNEHVAALEDRGHLLAFEPDAPEVHRRTAEWFDDQEVFDFLAEWLHAIPNPSMRHYVRARELKQAGGIDWKEDLLKRWLPPRRRLAACLKADESFTCEEDRVRAFAEQGGGSRATYFRYAKLLEPPAAPPRIVLGQKLTVAHPYRLAK